MIVLTADSGGICDINIACADLDEICHSTVPTTDLNEFCCKSHNLPDPSIPALPSYELTGLPASCAFRPMTVILHVNMFELPVFGWVFTYLYAS